MSIDRDEVRRIAALAHLEFDEAGLQQIGADLTRILDYIDQLKDVPIEEIVPTAGMESTPLGEDQPRPSLDRDAVAGNAPSFLHGHFVVPRVIGGES